MDRVLLFSIQTTDIKIEIEAYFDEAENLVIDGYDIGKTVTEYWGDSDYEYTTTISPQEVKILYTLFNLPPDSKKDLLSYIQSNYNTNKCYSEIQTLLDQQQIKYKGFSWR